MIPIHGALEPIGDCNNGKVWTGGLAFAVTFTAAETGNAYGRERPKTRVRSCERSLSPIVKKQEVCGQTIALQFNNQNS